MIKDLIIKNRSYRRFDENYRLTRKDLMELVDLARLSASAANRQFLRFLIIYSEEKCSSVFSCLKWAGYLTEWNGPANGERPAAYIIILKPECTNSYIGHDTGIAAQSILLGAVEKDLGGCIFGSVDRNHLTELINIPAGCEIEIVIALGKPVEIVKIETCSDNNIRYWRDENNVHHVPKRELNILVIDSDKD